VTILKINVAQHPVDAVYAAARDLCANGAAGGRDLAGAVFAFNHDTRYVSQVLALARAYGRGSAGTHAAGTAGTIAVAWALAQAGTPYVWGGETPGAGFDCSGLVQAAYRAAGISLPRVAQDQFDAGPHLPPGAVLEPGDLVFFGASTSSVTHVGIYAGARDGQAVMVDAPHAGADVRVEPFPATPGAPWGADIYLGATRPGH
jgi:cell wall-associated NlpC family hydrolase